MHTVVDFYFLSTEDCFTCLSIYQDSFVIKGLLHLFCLFFARSLSFFIENRYKAMAKMEEAKYVREGRLHIQFEKAHA